MPTPRAARGHSFGRSYACRSGRTLRMRAASRRSSCSAWARPGAPRSPARCRTRPAAGVPGVPLGAARRGSRAALPGATADGAARGADGRERHVPRRAAPLGIGVPPPAPAAPGAPWTVITTVREPVAQAVSAFFHGGAAAGALAARSSVDARRAARAEDWVRAPLRWFDREFAPALGIDVFAEPFDPAVRARRDRRPAVRVLLLRQENLASRPERARGSSASPSPVAGPAPQRRQRPEYAPSYRRVPRRGAAARATARAGVRLRYARHFYAEGEIARFRRRWSKTQRLRGRSETFTAPILACRRSTGRHYDLPESRMAGDETGGQTGGRGERRRRVEAQGSRSSDRRHGQGPRGTSRPPLTHEVPPRTPECRRSSAALVAVGIKRPRNDDGTLGRRSWKRLCVSSARSSRSCSSGPRSTSSSPAPSRSRSPSAMPASRSGPALHITLPFTTTYSMPTRVAELHDELQHRRGRRRAAPTTRWPCSDPTAEPRTSTRPCCTASTRNRRRSCTGTSARTTPRHSFGHRPGRASARVHRCIR